jgi:UDP-N-acetylglucosamine--dolichyl-phosphate N-acetylglucosaminephosphotransferase
MAYTTYLTIIVPALVSFVVTILSVYFVKSYFFESGIVSYDNNKKGKPIITASGGFAVACGFVIGILAYASGASFNLYIPTASLTVLFAVTLAVVLETIAGFLDDLNVKKVAVKTTDMMDIRKGLKQWQKPLFALFGAIPLIAINAGISTINLPIVGPVNFGLFYPLLILPLAVIFVTNAFNLVGGFDGIATGSGLVIFLGLLLYSLLYGSELGALISGVMVAALAAFAIFTFFPAKILPGDSLYFGMSAAFVAAIVVGNMEAFGIVLFLPYIIEFVLHLRKRFKVTDLGKLQKDGTMAPPYGKKIYSWCHLFMNLKRAKEWEVSLYMWITEALFVLLAFSMHWMHLL